MMRSAEHVTWDAYMATSEARARAAGTMSLLVAAFASMGETLRQVGKTINEMFGQVKL